MGLVTPGKAESSPVVLVDHVQVVKIQSGNNHLVCLTKDGEIFTCGCAEQGQLGRVAEYFSNRGGRKGLGEFSFFFFSTSFLPLPFVIG